MDWGKLVDVDGDEVINAPKQRERTANKEVQVFMRTFLRDGAKPSKAIEEAFNEAGIKCANWQRAAKSVAKSRPITGKGKGAGYEWYLPALEQSEFDGLKKSAASTKLDNTTEAAL